MSADCTNSKTEDNKVSFLHYTELGWEVTVGRLKVIRMINENRISKNDTIITLEDRTFLYSKFCKVQPFKTDPKPPLGLTPTNENYSNWLHELYVYDGKIGPWRWKQDIPKILDFDYEECNPPPFVVINHRIRNHDVGRNGEEENTRSLVSMVMDLGYKAFIAGRYADSIDPRAEYVPKLRTVMSLSNHRNCCCFIGSGGPVLLAQQCCRSKVICLNACCKNCLDISSCEKCNFMIHPLFLSKYANFTGCKQYVVPFFGIEEIRKIIKN